RALQEPLRPEAFPCFRQGPEARGWSRSDKSACSSRMRKRKRRREPAFPGSAVDHFLIRKSSTFLPFLVSAAIQRGCLPRPVQVSFGLAGLRYFGATLPSLRPFFATLRGAVADFVARPPNSSAMV